MTDFQSYWYGDASKKTTEEKATTKQIAWMEKEWLAGIRVLLTRYPMLQADLETIGDRAARAIIATKYWDGKRRCCKCQMPVDKWFRGKFCRECWFEEH